MSNVKQKEISAKQYLDKLTEVLTTVTDDDYLKCIKYLTLVTPDNITMLLETIHVLARENPTIVRLSNLANQSGNA